ncbi:MAG: DNA repair protein RecN [candidate division Zixibacteria bacterium]|nr:DNA repair protein RecN [candidate division Zixibacteria bacterium]
MLSRLAISNFGLVGELELSFDPGLTIITGETGAGKSLLVGAVGFLLGERGSAELVRSGALRATVEGIFTKLPGDMRPLLDEGGIEPEAELILRRELNRDGNSRAFANSRGITAGFLSRLGDFLVDFHGQHEHQSLLNAANHRYLFDRVVISDQQLFGVAEAYARLRQKQKAWNEFLNQRKLTPEEAELLSFQVQEIRAVGLSDDEEAKLSAERKILENVEKLRLSLETALSLLDEGEAPARLQIAAALKELKRGETLDNTFSDWVGRLESISAELNEVAREAGRYRSNLDASPDRLAEVLDRLNLYQQLKRKYGGSVEAVLDFEKKAENRLSAYHSQKSLEQELQLELREAEKNYLDAAGEISGFRKRAVPRFVRELDSHLKDLALKETAFEVRFDLKEFKDGIEWNGSKVACDEAGFDQIEFLFSANPGEEPKPLVKTASGGELSRLMLALKLLAAGKDQPATLVFDEIDQGLGGDTAYRVGEKLLEASRHYQIFCITHLQQIAALANHHLLVSKEKVGARNQIRVADLSETERKAEIARMLAGSRAGEAALKQAEEMLVRQRGVRKIPMAAKPSKRK